MSVRYISENAFVGHFLGFLVLSVNSISAQGYNVHDNMNNMSHAHLKSYSIGVMPEVKPPYAIAFIFGTLALAVLVRLLWIKTNIRLPYAVVLFAVGALIGWLASEYDSVHDYTESICEMSPKYMMMIFFPILIFRTAYSIDVYAFKRNLRQIILISVIGFLFVILLTSAISKGLYFGQSWELAIMLAAISSTSYPQDIIILLSEQGQSKQLSMLFEGEALLVDCAAIVVFNILLGYVTGYVTDALHIWILCMLFIAGGPILGFIIGKITAYILSRIFNDIVSAASVTLVVAYISYYFAEEVLGLSGVLCIVVLGIVISTERISLSSEVDYFLLKFWEILSFFASALIFMMVGVLIFEVISGKIVVQEILNAFILYIICFLSRTIMIIGMSFVFKYTGCFLPVRSTAVLIFGHLRGAVCLCLALVVNNSEGLEDNGYKFLIYASFLVLLTQVLNGCTLQCVMKTLGMTEVSLARRASMNSAIRYLLMTRERSLNMVKMDRHLAGANWMIVQEATQITHPYAKSKLEEGEDKFGDFAGYRFVLCPECQKEILTQPTKSEYREMQKEANLRILKAKKVSYRRQYEHGLLSKEATHILVTAVEIAADREDPVMEIDDLKGSWTRKKIPQYIRRYLIALMLKKETYLQPPQQKVALNCYKIVTSSWFEYFMYYIIILNIIVIIVEFIYEPQPYSDAFVAIMVLNHIFCALFIAEFVMKLAGLGIKNYFKSTINILDLIILTVSLVDLILHYNEIYNKFVHTSTAIAVWEIIARLFPVLRLIRFIKLFRRCVPRLIVLLDNHLDAQLKQSYDVGKGFVSGEEEILKILVHIVDDRKIYVRMKERIEDDRLTVSKRLAIIQKDYPEIAINVKTRQAIRTVLNKLQEAVKELKDDGLLDDFEYSKCMNIIENNLNYLRTHCQKINSCPPHVLLQEVSWVGGDTILESFLFEKTRPVNFNHGEVIIGHGAIPESLFVILYGVVKLVYVPSDQALNNLKTFGALPNVDYFTTLYFEERQEEFVLPGNVIGELGILTGRPYDSTALCETSVQAYEISLTAMLEAMYDSPDPSTGLKARIWKAVALRIAHVILTNTPHYQSWTQDAIKYHLERAFVPTLSQNSVFTVSAYIEDILLIEGQVMDGNSKNIYYAPCYIPRTIQILIFPQNRLMNVDTVIETKLLIIPVKYCDEVDVIEDGHGVRITSSLSTLCLRHTVRGPSSKGIPHGLWRKGHKRHRDAMGDKSFKSVPNMRSTRSSIKPMDETKIYGVYSTSIHLSEDSEKIQNVIEASSWKTLSERNDGSYQMILPKISDSKSQKVSFEDEKGIYGRSDIFRLHEPRMDSLHLIGSNGLPVSPEDTVAVQSMKSNSSGSSESSSQRRGSGTGEEELVLPFKRVFMPDIIEKEEDDSNN